MCDDSRLWFEILYKATGGLISGLISGLIQWAYSVLYADWHSPRSKKQKTNKCI